MNPMDRKEAKFVELDVRSYLRQNQDPFQLIMNTVKTLDHNDIFVLHATFKPIPLFAVLRMKGYASKAEQIDKDHWMVTFVKKKNKHWLDESGSSMKEEADGDGAQHTDGISPTENAPKIIQLDNRGLEPPQPMIRTLDALEGCRPGDEVVIHNDRVPAFLIEELNSLGFLHTVEEQPDGSAKVNIRKK